MDQGPISRWQRLWAQEKAMAAAVWKFVYALSTKCINDDVLFLASGMAFNFLICLLPIFLLWIYVLGMWFPSSDSIAFVDQILSTAFPSQPYALDIRAGISTILEQIMANGKSFGLLSVGVLLIASASLFSSTRSVLDRAFEVRHRHPILLNYVFDLLLVLGLTALILGTTSLTWVFRALHGLDKYLPPRDLQWIDSLRSTPELISIPLIFICCYLFYRYIPSQKIKKPTCLVSAAITSITWELSARIFAWYLSTLTSFGKIYGTYAFILVLMLWTFYSSAIFVLGAEAGHVLEVQGWLRKRQKS